MGVCLLLASSRQDEVVQFVRIVYVFLPLTAVILKG